MRGALVALAIVVSACSGSPQGGASPTPGGTSPVRFTPSRTESPTASPSPTRLNGSVVRVSVNGVDYPPNTFVSDPGLGPTTVVLTFPFAVDRASVERWGLSGQPTKTWLDDRTLRLVFAETEPSIGLKVAETLSVAGDAVIDFFVVNVSRSTRLVSVYTVAELAAAGSANFARASGSWRVPGSDGLALAPDAKRVLSYDGFGPLSGPVPSFVDLDTKTATPLTQPPASDGWFSFADWMADGRLVMVGRGVWVGDANAGGMKRIADAQALLGGYPWSALPDPTETHIAIWGYNTDGHVPVVDLSNGAVRMLAGPFRRCAADGFASFAWSADGRFLAGTDCDGEEGPAKARVRIVDVAADRTVRTIEGGVYSINGLPTGNFVLVRDAGESGAGFRLLGLIVGFDGQERGRYLGHAWQMSADRRYLLQTRFQPAGGPDYTLFDLVNGTSATFAVPCGDRNAGGCPNPHWMRDGRLAFY